MDNVNKADFLFGTRVLTVLDMPIQSLPHFDNDVSVIVSSDDNHLTHGGGVSAAIWRAAGKDLSAFVARNRHDLRLGDIWISVPGKLEIQAIYHAITIDFDSNRVLGPDSAVTLYGKLIDHAGFDGARKLGIPLLGSGVAGLESAVSATALAQVLRERASILTPTVQICLCCLSEMWKSCCEIMEKRQIIPLGPIIRDAAQCLPRRLGNRILQLWDSMGSANGDENGWRAIKLYDLLLNGIMVSIGRVEKAQHRMPHLQADYDRLSLVEKLRDAETLLGSAGSPMSNDMRNACRAAVHARNLYAHNRPLGSEINPMQTLSAILEACRYIACKTIRISNQHSKPGAGDQQVRKRILDRVLSVGADRLGVALSAGSVKGAVAREVSSPVAPDHTAKPTKGKSSGKSRQDAVLRQARCASVGNSPGPTRPATGYTQPVRKLQAFLIEHTDPAAREELTQELGRLRYSGDGDLRILEYCVRAPDPASLLTTHVGAPVLRRELIDYGYRKLAATTDASILARQLLTHFGFPAISPPQGLSSIAASVTIAASRLVSMSDVEELSGSVTRGASSIEYLLQIFIRFLAKVLLGEAPEPYLRRKKRLPDSMPLSRCTMGALIEMLTAMSKDIDSPSTVEAKILLGLLTRRPLLPAGSASLPELRNRFAHFGKVKREADWAVVHEAAGRFFLHASQVLEYLAAEEYRMFPKVIKVTRIIIDEWGRRRIEAVADDGMYECLFVDEMLEPGTAYLMHPLTNPMRVDPILVPVGDLDQ